MFGRRLRTCLDLLKPDVRAKLGVANFKQQRDHDKAAQPRSFAAGDPVWVMKSGGTGYQQGEILRRTGPLSYVVLRNGKCARKHADQLRFRRAAEVDANRNADIDADVNREPVQLEVEQLLPAQPAWPDVTVQTESPPMVQTAPPPEMPSPEIVSLSVPEAAPDPVPLASRDPVGPPATLRRSQRTRRCHAKPYDDYL
jgi:hypothetical protein